MPAKQAFSSNIDSFLAGNVLEKKECPRDVLEIFVYRFLHQGFRISPPSQFMYVLRDRAQMREV